VRTVEEVLAELRSLVTRAANGENVTQRRTAVVQELGTHGIHLKDDAHRPAAPTPGASSALDGALRQRGLDPNDPGVQAIMMQVLAGTRAPSRFAGPNADPAWLDTIASQRTPQQTAQDMRLGGDFLRAVHAARRGDPSALAELSRKGWTGGSDPTGGYFINPDILPGYIAKRNAAAPLRVLCREFNASSDEVRIILEGTTVTVSMVPEAGTKPDSTGSIAQKIGTIFKAAGTTHISTEDLADTDGQVADLVQSQFGVQVGLTIDNKIIAGSGTGEPKGIIGTSGVNIAPLADDGSAPGVFRAVAMAASRLRQRFYEPAEIAIVVHPLVALEFDVALNTLGEPLYPGGISEALRQFGRVVYDSNLPLNRGDGNDGLLMMGAFKDGAYFFSRQPLSVDSSEHAAWQTNEVVFRGEERFGFACVKPEAFEVIDAIPQFTV
jgi:HK97 family phage major capsid protein